MNCEFTGTGALECERSKKYDSDARILKICSRRDAADFKYPIRIGTEFQIDG